MDTYRIFQVDSFTNERFKGNPAGVVYDADGLTDKQMQMIARELNNSETAFLLSTDRDDADIQIRYFAPTTEVPICGHATIAAMYVKALIEKPCTSTYLCETKAGVLPFKIIENDYNYSIAMTQGKIEFLQKIENTEKARLLNAFGIQESDLIENVPIQEVSTGYSKILIPMKSRDQLNSLTPNNEELISLSKEIGCNGFFTFVLDNDENKFTTYGRMFAPAIGINEDPVTGNANGPLGAYLVKYGLSGPVHDEFSFVAKQGETIKRFGKMIVNVGISHLEPVHVDIIGEAVMVYETEIDF